MPAPAPDATIRPRLRTWQGLVLALAMCLGVSVVGGLFTALSVDSWYQELDRPSWNPPGWVFGPVWLTLYSMMAVALWWAWRSDRPTKRATAWFVVQLALNLTWSALFFGLRSPGLALVEICLLLIGIAATAVELGRVRPVAGWLMAPYFAWVCFAAVLNGTIWRLNAG